MPKLTIYRGISGSGKSTDSSSRNAAIVSRDKLRVALIEDMDHYYQRPKEYIKAMEDMVTVMEQAAIEAHLKAGRDVISDNTNIEPKFCQAIADVGYRNGADVEVRTFDVPLSTATQNNGLRAARGGHDVPDAVIRKQHDRWQSTKDWEPTRWAPTPYTGTPGKPEAILVDIDGTLAHNNGKRGFFDWSKVGLDDYDYHVCDIVNVLSEDYEIIIMSGRDEVCRLPTENWLEGATNYTDLFMRPRGDMRKDSVIKSELFDNYVRDNYDVIAVIDDRWQVIRDCWLPMGLKVFNVSGADRGEF